VKSRAQIERQTMISKVLLAATVMAAVTSVLALSALGTPPDASATGEQVAAWFVAHASAVRWFVWFSLVSAPPVAVMVAILRMLLPAPHRDVFLIGGIGLIVTGSVQTWFWAGLALHAAQLEPSLARTLFDVPLFWGPVLTACTMMTIGPVTLLGWQRESGMPRWLTLLGAVTFAEQAVETITVFGKRGFVEPGGAMNMQLGAGLFFLWWFGFAMWAALRHPQLAHD
jgi:hypothetical protein